MARRYSARKGESTPADADKEVSARSQASVQVSANGNPTKPEGRLRVLDRKAASATNILAAIGTIIGILTFLFLVWDHRPTNKVSTGGVLPALSNSIDPVQGRLNNVHVTQGFSLGDGCQDDQWDCSKFSEDDYDRLGMLVTFDLETLGTSGSTLEVVWRLLAQNDSPGGEPTEIASGPGWPKGTFPIVAMEDTRTGTLWLPYPNVVGRFFVELNLTGLPNGAVDSLNSGTFDLPISTATSGTPMPMLQGLPTMESGEATP